MQKSFFLNFLVISMSCAVAALIAVSPLLVNAQSTTSGGDKGEKDRCKHKEIFQAGGARTPKGSKTEKPYAPDEARKLRQRLEAQGAMSLNDIDAFVRRETARRVKSGEWCDGHTSCGGLWYETAGGVTKFICDNRCAPAGETKKKCAEGLDSLLSKVQQYTRLKDALTPEDLKKRIGDTKDLPKSATKFPKAFEKAIDDAFAKHAEDFQKNQKFKDQYPTGLERVQRLLDQAARGAPLGGSPAQPGGDPLGDLFPGMTSGAPEPVVPEPGAPPVRIFPDDFRGTPGDLNSRWDYVPLSQAPLNTFNVAGNSHGAGTYYYRPPASQTSWFGNLRNDLRDWWNLTG